jgi:DNA polymerase III epsilon subunit-like protein
MNYFIIDTETTGLPDYKTGTWPKLISIALIHACIINDELEIYNEKEWYVNDWVEELSDETSKFLNITKEFIKKHGKLFKDVETEIYNYIKNYKDITFVAHNVQFDMNVLKNCGMDLTQYNWYCTMLNGLVYLQKLNNYKKYPKLMDLARHFNICIETDKLHAALYDAQICAHVFYCIKTLCYQTKLHHCKILELRNRNVIFTF